MTGRVKNENKNLEACPKLHVGWGPGPASMVIWPRKPTRTPFFSVDAEDITLIDHLMIILGI